MIKKVKKWLKKNWKEIVIDLFIFAAAAGIILSAIILIWVSTLEIPDLSNFEERLVLQSTKIYDRTGEVLLYDLHQDVKRTIIPLEEMSKNIKNATLAIEDDQFYNHMGVRPTAILRSIINNIQTGKGAFGGAGGSTITQQVIKNSLLDRDKKISRKVKEAILAIKLERLLEKDDILEIYLNESPYGGTIYGVAEASRAFFDKKASELTIAESAYLAAIPQAPTYFSPSGNNRDKLDERKNLVLERMRLNGFITIDEYEEAKNEEVDFKTNAINGIKAPHFVMYVVEQLVEKFGEEAMSEQGYKIITTLDWELQEEAEKIVLEKSIINEEKFNATNAGLVATDPKTGDLLVMVGSKDYFSEDIDGNFNITRSPRQPGSSIKPFVYAAAFKKGYLPATVLFDVPTQFSSSCAADDTSSKPPCYAPSNYNHKFIGPVSMRNSLARSLNIPAVKTLYLTGLGNTLTFIKNMGITTLNDPERFGLTLVLGGGEVKLLDMTNAYGVFANAGIKAEPRSILRIEDSYGELVEETEVKTSRVLDENVAYMISDVLSDNVARTPLWGSNSLVHFPNRDVAAKSGSTNDLRDAWIMGYTPNLTVGAWVGNNDNTSMGGGLSGLITTPMWREFMDVALEKFEVESFPQPKINTQGVKPIIRGEYIDTNLLLSTLQNNTEEGEENEVKVDLATIYGNVHSILHFVNKNDPLGGYPANPTNDQQYYHWEYGVQKWNEETFGILLDVNKEDEDEDKDEDE